MSSYTVSDHKYLNYRKRWWTTVGRKTIVSNRESNCVSATRGTASTAGPFEINRCICSVTSREIESDREVILQWIPPPPRGDCTRSGESGWSRCMVRRRDAGAWIVDFPSREKWLVVEKKGEAKGDRRLDENYVTIEQMSGVSCVESEPRYSAPCYTSIDVALMGIQSTAQFVEKYHHIIGKIRFLFLFLVRFFGEGKRRKTVKIKDICS